MNALIDSIASSRNFARVAVSHVATASSSGVIVKLALTAVSDE